VRYAPNDFCGGENVTGFILTNYWGGLGFNNAVLSYYIRIAVSRLFEIFFSY